MGGTLQKLLGASSKPVGLEVVLGGMGMLGGDPVPNATPCCAPLLCGRGAMPKQGQRALALKARGSGRTGVPTQGI